MAPVSDSNQNSLSIGDVISPAAFAGAARSNPFHADAAPSDGPKRGSPRRWPRSGPRRRWHPMLSRPALAHPSNTAPSTPPAERSRARCHSSAPLDDARTATSDCRNHSAGFQIDSALFTAEGSVNDRADRSVRDAKRRRSALVNLEELEIQRPWRAGRNPAMPTPLTAIHN